MDIDPELKASIDEQIKYEFGAAYQYLAASTFLNVANFEGMASWMFHQSREEVEHALKFINFLIDRDIEPTLLPVDAPDVNFVGPLSVFEKALRSEQNVTLRINSLYRKASEKNDYSTQVLLHWFITEQVEEERSIGAVVDRLRKVGSDYGAMLVLDQTMSTRGWMAAGDTERDGDESDAQADAETADRAN